MELKTGFPWTLCFFHEWLAEVSCCFLSLYCRGFHWLRQQLKEGPFLQKFHFFSPQNLVFRPFLFCLKKLCLFRHHFHLVPLPSLPRSPSPHPSHCCHRSAVTSFLPLPHSHSALYLQPTLAEEETLVSCPTPGSIHSRCWPRRKRWRTG